jgi:muramoyltetrapeptide carboxypeptidase LdcA involved in peptidoglycan recycling
LNAAFADPTVRAVFASIGGDDAVRVIPHLDDDLVRANPKIVMGYSDTTALLVHIHQLGIIAFNGPSIMAGVSQLAALPAMFEEHLRTMLFEAPETYTYPCFGEYAASRRSR